MWSADTRRVSEEAPALTTRMVPVGRAACPVLAGLPAGSAPRVSAVGVGGRVSPEGVSKRGSECVSGGRRLSPGPAIPPGRVVRWGRESGAVSGARGRVSHVACRGGAGSSRGGQGGSEPWPSMRPGPGSGWRREWAASGLAGVPSLWRGISCGPIGRGCGSAPWGACGARGVPPVPRRGRGSGARSGGGGPPGGGGRCAPGAGLRGGGGARRPPPNRSGPRASQPRPWSGLRGRAGGCCFESARASGWAHSWGSGAPGTRSRGGGGTDLAPAQGGRWWDG